MMRNLHWARIGCLAALFFILAEPVQAQVKDDAGFFTAPAVSQADQVIKQINQGWNKDVKVETVKGVPADKLEKFKTLDKGERNKFYEDWARARAKGLGVKGVFILIVKQQGHLEIDVDDDTSKKGFAKADRKDLRDLLLDNFKKKEFDKGLTDGLALVRARLEKNLGAALPPPVAGVILDQAGYFSAAARDKAAERIKEFKAKQQFELTIETFARVYAGAAEKVSAMPKEKRGAFFRDWTRARAQQAGAKGVWVLICKDPAYIQASLGAQADKSGKFSPADRDGLRKGLAGGFDKKQYDQTLERALAFVYETLRAFRVKDDARYFKEETLAVANQKIKSIRRKFKRDVLIETFALAADKKEAYEKLEDAKAKDKFFADLLQERAKTAGAGGVQVLICKDPQRIQVGVAADTVKKFPASERDLLRNLLVERFPKDADKSLLEAVSFIQGTLPALAIKDDAGFFSPAGLDKGNAAVRDIRRRFARDVLIETFNEVPADLVKGINLEDAKVRRKFFTTWAIERQKANNLDAISLLVCKNPMSLQVAIGPETGKKFSIAERDKLVGIVLAKFKSKEYDAGLAAGLEAIAGALKKTQFIDVKEHEVGKTGGGHDFGGGKGLTAIGTINGIEKKHHAKEKNTDKDKADKEKNLLIAQGPGDTKPKPSPVKDFMNKDIGGFKMEWLIWGILGLLALWILIGVLRSLFARRPAYPYPPPQQPQQGGYGGARPPMPGQQPGYGAHPPYYGSAPSGGGGGGGGGGFFAGLLGGMFGAAAGNWLYNRFSGGSSVGGVGGMVHSGSTPQVTHSPETPGTQSAAAGYSSSGGDFGETPEKTEGYSSSGGDFGEAAAEGQQGYSSSGGDFGQEAEAGGSSAGGDFGTEQSEPADTGGGGDFGSDQSEPADSGGGGDFGGGEAAGAWDFVNGEA
jgi:uncharacterized membrane protein YgcG